MDQNQESLKAYIRQQLAAGMGSDQIAAQLHAAGWPMEQTQPAFQAIQAEIMPTAYPSTALGTQPQAATTAGSGQLPQASGKRRGRIKVGWQLFIQSARLLNGNRYLLKYMLMTTVWVVGINLAIIALLVVVVILPLVDRSGSLASLNVIYYILAFFDYLLVYFFINLYAAGLAANILDIFQGKRQPYKQYMKLAWSKAPAIFVFSLISATIGMFLQFVVERIRWVGWILAWLLGTAWSLGTLFVVPIIITTERPNALVAIKQSVRFFKQTWGESVVTKISVNTPLAVLNIVLLFVLMMLLFAIQNVIASFTLLGLYVLTSMLLAIIGSFCNSAINVALFYYAQYRQVPPAFDESLLNQVFIQRKRRFFKKKNAQTT